MRRLMRWLFTAGVGAAVAYLFDPEMGRTRRARLREQAGARARDVAAEAQRTARYQAGRMKGTVSEMIPEEPPEDDATLLQKVRSEAVGPSGVSTEQIEIHVDNGVVVLRGSVPDRHARDNLVERVSQVTGVREVQPQLTTEGED